MNVFLDDEVLPSEPESEERCLSIFDKFQREYRLVATGWTGDYTSERMC